MHLSNIPILLRLQLAEIVTPKQRSWSTRRMEHPFSSLILQTLILLSLFSLVANQVCNGNSYTLISNPRRSTKATYDDTVDNNPICDEGINEGIWHRFSSYSGDEIVERAANDPVPMLQCGTEAPIYIRGLGSHPVTDYAGTTATVCAHYQGNPCNWMATIQIYRCPGYYLYKLKSPQGCPIAYCAGDKNVCDRGDYWNGFECVNYYPSMTGFPVFTGPFVNGSGLSEEVYFRCQVQYDRQPNDDFARFRVTFLFDGQPLQEIGSAANFPPEILDPIILNPDSNLVATLNEFHLRGRLGRVISCQADSFWDGSGFTNSTMRSVDAYYAAFESTSQSYSISLTNGSTFNVTFKSTLPFTCRHCVGVVPSCCRYRFRMLNFTASSAQCFLFWLGGDSAVVTVYFLPGTTRTQHYFALVFEKYNDDIVLPPTRSLWHDYIIPPVPMTIIPKADQYKRCGSTGDPHIVTFDGRYFDHYLVGDFYLTRAINDEQFMEVQVRHAVCGAVACNCGIIVREGNSVIKISTCVNGSPTVVRLLSQDPADSSTVYIDGTGSLYSVRMPSGLRVEVWTAYPYIHVEVFLPPEYHGKTDSYSMCGNCDGNINNDFYTDVARFRIPDNLSYFRQQPACLPKFNEAATRCGCNGTYPICSNKDPTLTAISKPDKPFQGRWGTGTVCTKPSAVAVRSSLFDSSNSESDFIVDDDILFPPYTYDPNFGVNVSFTWPTSENKEQVDVENYCSDMLQSSPAYDDCSANVDVATIIAMCVSDIQILDEWIPISAYAYAFEQGCLNTIAASINNSDSNISDSTLEQLTSVSGKLCPNQCSGQGTCSEGNCTCNTGYIGADCSIDQSRPPSLTSMFRGGVCDVRVRPCDVISVYGSGVAFSSALKCRFTDQTTGDQGVTDGTFITADEYSCPVPETTTHRRRRSATTRTTALSATKVSITIDGVLYSNALDFVLFDSVCVECNNSGTCRQKDNSCIISNECSTDKAVNPDDSCLQCVPSLSRNSWTNITVAQEWSPCTRQCDTGVAARDMVCGTTVANQEVEFCKVSDCPDDAEQEKQGFGITLSSEDLKLILRDPDGSLAPFSDALNLYCSKNAPTCCKSIKMPTGASTVTYTSTDLLTYASGHPVVGKTDASLQIIVKIDRFKLAAECSQTQTQESNIVYADSKLIYDAVNSEKSQIEEELRVTIVSVWSANPALQSTASAMGSSLFSVICIYFLLKGF